MKKGRYSPAVRELLAGLARGLSGKRMLDLGCGTGLATGVLLERFPGAHIVGLDCSKEMLVRYARNYPQAKAILGDFNQPDLFRGSINGLNSGHGFDLIVSTGAVSEYGDPVRTLPVIHSVLREGGVFLNIGIDKNVVNTVLGKLWAYTPERKERFLDACRSTGFSQVEERAIPWRFFPTNLLKYIILANK